MHLGTHKTGTTSIQRTLTANQALLQTMGFSVPRAGRSLPQDGHHNIAWELAGDERFDPRRGTFDDVLHEVVAAGMSRAVLSSEDFEYLHARPERLQRLADGFARIGFAVVPVIYLRPQAGYAESLYAELVKHGLAEPFDAFLDTLLRTGEYRFGDWRFTFDYARLLANVAAVFGESLTIVRSYTAARDDVVEDFLRVIGADALIASPERVRPPRLNAGSRVTRVLERLEGNASPRLPGAAVPGLAGESMSGAFDPVHLRETLRVTARFNAGNRQVFGRYGVVVPCVSGPDLCADLAAAVGIDAGGQARKQLIAAHARRIAPPRPVGARLAPARPTRGVSLPHLGRRLSRAPFRSVARIESISAAAALMGCLALVLGLLTARTALTEFGMFSLLAAVTAAARLVRCALAAYGTLIDEAFFTEWALRLTMTGYGVVALYAAVNALLDVGVPRYAPDWICVRGAAAIALAIAGLCIFVRARVGAPREDALREALARPAGEGALIAFGSIALGLELLHAASPVWWLDTLVDVLAVLIAYTQYRALWRRFKDRDASADVWLAGYADRRARLIRAPR